MSEDESNREFDGVMAADEDPMAGEHNIIAVDFDKTLTEGEESYITDDPTGPNEEMVEWVNYQYRNDNTIIIWTARPWAAAEETVGRLTDWGVDWHGIRMEKGEADVYVDDNATTPTEELLEAGFDADGEVDPGEGKIDKNKDGNPDETGSE